MKQPVAAFFDQRLTDAPFQALAARLRLPSSFKHLSFAAARMVVEERPGELRLEWTRNRFAAKEHGCLLVRQDERGAYLSVEVRQKGWGGFLSFGLLRWHAEDLLDRLIDEFGTMDAPDGRPELNDAADRAQG